MPDSVIFTIGDFAVRWYGVVIMLGVLAATLLSQFEAQRRGENKEHVWGMLPWVLVLGILGARLGWVISEAPSRSFNNIGEILFGASGGFGIRGLSIQGALVGGIIAVMLYCWRQRLSFLTWVDVIVPGLALAQAMGRWGNYFNQEAFGRPTDLPWGIQISVEQQAAVAGPNAGFTPSGDLRFHPTFAYEMIWNLLNCGLLLWLGRQRRIRLVEGDLLWVYLIVYSVGRYLIEAIRVDSAMISGFRTPQIVALATIALAAAIMGWRHRKGSKALPAAMGPKTQPADESAAVPSGSMATVADGNVSESGTANNPAEQSL